MKQILFLCTGNYYRSRFAEILFNELAARMGSCWRAVSRGLALAPDNVGPISPQTVRALAQRDIRVHEPVRFPQAVTQTDLQNADLIVALKEAEHRPLLEAAFPGWATRVEFWHIDDLDVATADVALPALERRLRCLLDGLRRTE